MTLVSYGKILLIVFVAYFLSHAYFNLIVDSNDYKSYFYEVFEQRDLKHVYHVVDDEKKVCSDDLFRWQENQWRGRGTKYITNDPTITRFNWDKVEYDIDKFNTNCALSKMRTNQYKLGGLNGKQQVYRYDIISQDYSQCKEYVWEDDLKTGGRRNIRSRVMEKNNVWFLDYYLYHTYCYKSW